jgi:hypothetical protein
VFWLSENVPKTRRKSSGYFNRYLTGLCHDRTVVKIRLNGRAAHILHIAKTVPRRAKFLGTVLAGSKNYSRIPAQTEECRKLSENASIVPYARIVPAGRRCKLEENHAIREEYYQNCKLPLTEASVSLVGSQP